MRFRFLSVAAFAAALVANASIAEARVNITIDLSTQRMHVSGADGSYTWKVSTGRGKYNTPRGNYRPYLLKRMHYSRKYDNAPMPYSIFFRGGYAIHGTNSIRALGRPASHGCIRLAPGNAAKLFSMVKREGARISIIGSRDTFYANNPAPAKKRYAKKSAKKKHIVAKRDGSQKYAAAKRYNTKKYAKKKQSRKYTNTRSNSRSYAASRHRGGAPMAYAPQRSSQPTGIFRFFHNPNSPWN